MSKTASVFRVTEAKFAAASFCLAIVLLFGGLRVGAGKPQFVCGVTECDLGEIVPNQNVEHSFGFENHGSSVLRCTDVVASCMCTKVTVDPPSVEPGGKGLVKLEIKIPPFERSRPMRTKVVMNTNDPKLPKAVYKVRADVKSVYLTTPTDPRLQLSLDGATSTTSFRLHLRSGEDAEFSVKKLEPSVGWLSCTATPSQDGHASDISVHATGHASKTAETEFIKITTSYDRQPVVMIPVNLQRE